MLHISAEDSKTGKINYNSFLIFYVLIGLIVLFDVYKILFLETNSPYAFDHWTKFFSYYGIQLLLLALLFLLVFRKFHLHFLAIAKDEESVRSNKKKDERLVPIFPEIVEPLSECDARATEGTEWIIDQACPKQYRFGARDDGMKSANLGSTFDDIVTKAGLPVIPMIGNNMRASAVKDLYSGKYPELRGRIDLIGKIFGHSPQVAMTYYQRFQMDDFKELIETFHEKPCRENETHRQTTENVESQGNFDRAVSRDKSRASTETEGANETGEATRACKIRYTTQEASRENKAKECKVPPTGVEPVLSD